MIFVYICEFDWICIPAQCFAEPSVKFLPDIDWCHFHWYSTKKKQKEKKRPPDLKKKQPGARSAWTISPPTQFLGAIAKSSMQSTHWIWQIPTLPTFPTVDDLECLTMQKKNTGQFKVRSLWTIWTNVHHKSMKVSSRSQIKLSQRTLKNDWCNWHFSCPHSKFVHCSSVRLL